MQAMILQPLWDRRQYCAGYSRNVKGKSGLELWSGKVLTFGTDARANPLVLTGYRGGSIIRTWVCEKYKSVNKKG